MIGIGLLTNASGRVRESTDSRPTPTIQSPYHQIRCKSGAPYPPPSKTGCSTHLGFHLWGKRGNGRGTVRL